MDAANGGNAAGQTIPTKIVETSEKPSGQVITAPMLLAETRA
jgi:hypothetical protein